MLGSFAFGVRFQVVAAALARSSGHQKGHKLAFDFIFKSSGVAIRACYVTSLLWELILKKCKTW